MVAVAASLAIGAAVGFPSPTTSFGQAPTGQESGASIDITGNEGAVEVEIQRRFNELRREILDDRADAIGWWLAGIALFLTVLAVLIAFAGYLVLRRLREVEEGVRRGAQQARTYVEEVSKFVEEIRGYEGGADEQLRSMAGESIEFARTQIGDDVTRDPGRAGASAIADARLLEEEGRLDEAIERWRHIANVAEGTNNELAALAFRSIGDLSERMSRSR